DRQRHAVIPDDDRAAQGDSTSDRFSRDGKRPLLRGDECHLRHADGRRARHRTGRARRHADPGRLLLPDPRAVRQPRSQEPRAAPRRSCAARWRFARDDDGVRGTETTVIAIVAVLALPLIGGGVLAFVGERPYASRVNVAASLATFLAAAALTIDVILHGPQVALGRQFLVDPFNVFLVALTAFVAFTTSVFSRPYMLIEAEHGRLTVARLRLYHSMYQLFTFTMLLALLTNNVGVLWVAMEGATLTTVLLVSLYRTPASLEAAWKYFILCGVGIAQALF